MKETKLELLERIHSEYKNGNIRQALEQKFDGEMIEGIIDFFVVGMVEMKKRIEECEEHDREKRAV